MSFFTRVLASFLALVIVFGTFTSSMVSYAVGQHELTQAFEQTLVSNRNITVDFRSWSDESSLLPASYNLHLWTEGRRLENRMAFESSFALGFSGLAGMIPLEEFQSLGRVDLNAVSEGIYVSDEKTEYSQVKSFQLESDHDDFNSMAGLVEQYIKLLSGKYFRMSADELESFMRRIAQLDPHAGEFPHLPYISPEQQAEILLTVFDSAIREGILSVEKVSGVKYTVTVDAMVSDAQKANFAETLNDLLADVIPEGLRDLLPPDPLSVEALNMVLPFLHGRQVQLALSGTQISSVYLNETLALGPASVNVVIHSTLDFGYVAPITTPSDEEVIDLNAIFDGVTTMVGYFEKYAPQGTFGAAQPPSVFEPSVYDEIAEPPRDLRYITHEQFQSLPENVTDDELVTLMVLHCNVRNGKVKSNCMHDLLDIYYYTDAEDRKMIRDRARYEFNN